MPLMSLCSVLWVELRITGIPVEPPPPSLVVPPSFPVGRITVD